MLADVLFNHLNNDGDGEDSGDLGGLSEFLKPTNPREIKPLGKGAPEPSTTDLGHGFALTVQVSSKVPSRVRAVIRDTEGKVLVSGPHNDFLDKAKAKLDCIPLLIELIAAQEKKPEPAPESPKGLSTEEVEALQMGVLHEDVACELILKALPTELKDRMGWPLSDLLNGRYPGDQQGSAIALMLEINAALGFEFFKPQFLPKTAPSKPKRKKVTK